MSDLNLKEVFCTAPEAGAENHKRLSDDNGTPYYIDPISKFNTSTKKDQHIHRLQRVFEEVIESMGQIVEVRDVYTAGHQRRVSGICVEIAKIMALPLIQIKGLQLAALIHDIGKLAIPTEILSKPGRLSSCEFELIKTHPSIGFNIIKDFEFPWPIANIIHQHHERMNGSGYPGGLSGREILLEARIIAVADVIEAMASNRPYRPAIGIELALEEIRTKKYTLYDPNVVEACLTLFSRNNYVLN